MTISSLSARICDQRSFAMDTDHRRARGPRILRGLSVLLGLLVVGGAERASQARPV